MFHKSPNCPPRHPARQEEFAGKTCLVCHFDVLSLPIQRA